MSLLTDFEVLVTFSLVSLNCELQLNTHILFCLTILIIWNCFKLCRVPKGELLVRTAVAGY